MQGDTLKVHPHPAGRLITLLRVLVLALLVMLALVAALLGISLGTDWGRARVAARISSLISDQLAGDLEIGHIDALTLDRVEARDVRIFAPDGKPAIEARHAVISFDLRQLLSGRYGWRRAEIDGCTVHVTEGPDGKVNMEETFKSQSSGSKGAQSKDSSELDLQTMVTSGCTLFISGGSLPSLHMAELRGTMSVRVLPDGQTQLRFDDYRGTFRKGLPTGVLAFEDVTGHVHTQSKRLLSFRGRGRSEGEPVEFSLDIDSEPKTRVKIDALFPDLSAASIRALGVAAFGKFSSGLEMTVRHGK